VFEDIDANTNIVHSRDARDASGEGTTTSICGDSDSEFTLDFLLNILQGTLTRDDMVFVITTNYVEKLDAALIRDGRIDVKIEMKLCDNYQLQQMWKTIFKREVHPNVLSKFKTLSFTPASILSRCAQFITVNSMQDEDTEMIDLQILEPFV
jgi:ATP-dependent 26S proteasome regulatory subunit